MKMRVVELAIEEARQKGLKEGLSIAVKNYSTVSMFVLADKFDFTPEQLEEVAKHINNYFDSVNSGYVKISDISTTLQEENGVIVCMDGKVVRHG